MNLNPRYFLIPFWISYPTKIDLGLTMKQSVYLFSMIYLRDEIYGVSYTKSCGWDWNVGARCTQKQTHGSGKRQATAEFTICLPAIETARDYFGAVRADNATVLERAFAKAKTQRRFKDSDRILSTHRQPGRYWSSGHSPYQKNTI